jgi:hypothetical protein
MGISSEPRERLRSLVGNRLNEATQSGRRLPFGGAPARVIARALQPRADAPQPVQPRSEPSLGSVFSSKPDRAMYSGGRQMQKGWWP